MKNQQVNKAITAGHDVVPEGHGDNVENIDAASPTTTPKEEVAAEVSATATETVSVKEPKFASNLFNGFTLGSTLKQGPVGNIISNVKVSQR